MLSAFDQAAIDGNGGRDSSRALAAIADLLSYMANSDAGSCVRSGPASNQKWTPAFRKLEVRTSYRTTLSIQFILNYWNRNLCIKALSR